MTTYCRIPSPIDELIAVTNGQALIGLYMAIHKGGDPIKIGWQENPDHPVLKAAQAQLDEYFRGERHEFDLPLAAQGTEFQQQVWQSLTQIPYGTTMSYGDLARKLGNPDATRAVGLANGKNPISIIVPCHRVIGADGSLTGFGGGVGRKRFLLDLEATHGAGQGNLF